jgi:hypothetical protein
MIDPISHVYLHVALMFIGKNNEHKDFFPYFVSLLGREPPK